MKQLGILEAVQAYERTAEFLGLGAFALSLAVALAAALYCSALYRVFYESRGTGSQINRAFPALALAITTLFLCIQVSIPLSLGLLGSLSIIRFRTPIKEPEEVGAIMLVIASSIAAATFRFAFVAVMLAFAGVVAAALSRLRGAKFFKRDGMITVSAPDASFSGGMAALEEVLSGHLSRHSVLASSSHGGKTSLQITFSGLRTDPVALQNAVRAAVPQTEAANVFLDRPGGFR